MKKYLFIALAAAGMLSSCSSDDAVANEGVNAEGLVPIKIGMASTASVTRGMGTVGGTTDEANLWNGQVVNIFMFEKGSLKLAQNNNTAIFDNEPFNTPTGKTGTAADDYAKPVSNKINYYPAKGNFDFWGYYLDNASTASTTQPYVYNADSTEIRIPFVIDGSQDIMGGKALVADADTAGTGIGNDFYSAKAARKTPSIQPHIAFKHLLTRLTFEAKAGNANAADGTYPVMIDSIKIISKTTGEMIVASTTANGDSIVWNDAVTDSLALKDSLTTAGQRNVLVPVSLAGKQSAYAKVGDALLVAPSQNAYTMLVYMSQTKPTEYPSATPQAVSIDPLSLSVAFNGGFKAGYSYNVKLTVYGLEDIKVYTELVKWVNGGNIEIDPDANL